MMSGVVVKGTGGRVGTMERWNGGMLSRTYGRSLLLTFTILVGAGAGCARHSQTDDGSPPAEPAADVALVVDNHHWLDVTVYLVRGAASERIGTVPGNQTKSFVLPWRRLGAGSGIRLLADPIGSVSTLTSDDIYVQPGQEIQWTIDANFRNTSVAVY